MLFTDTIVIMTVIKAANQEAAADKYPINNISEKERKS
jgi:hypothetical protein